MASVIQRIQWVIRTTRTSWVLLGVTLLAILLTELSLRLVFAIKDGRTTTEQPDPRVLAEGYRGKSWPIQHFRELSLLQDRWEPYVYFRQRPFSGETIRIDPAGTRRSWQPPRPASPGRRPLRVTMLGGSSLWGFGARDDRTVPSLVARKLYERGCLIELRNLAEIGYVSTQEVVALVRELQAGGRPDLVIFYDGVNDSTSALLEGEAGVTTNERNRRAEFNIRQSAARLGATMLGRLVEDSAFYRLAGILGRRLAMSGSPTAALPSPERRRELVSAVLRRYRANLEIVDRLARGFGFEVLYYWQPVVFDKLSLTPFEREEAEKLAWARGFLADVYDAVRRSPELKAERRFHDLSRLFADSKNLIFIDYCHTTEEANDQIAEVMTRDTFEILRTRQPSSGGGDPTTSDVR